MKNMEPYKSKVGKLFESMSTFDTGRKIPDGTAFKDNDMKTTCLDKYTGTNNCFGEPLP